MCIMTLEDFFTLTEMKDGLTAPARVKELVNVMLKEKDCVVKNVGDATRQWSTVGSTIAATENKDCLDLFVQLDGLQFIDRWLKDAQKFGNDTGDSFVEESITALLKAIEKLQIDTEKSVSTGIFLTVKNLIGHSGSGVQDRARALFDSWKQDRDSDAVPWDIEKLVAFHDDGINVSANRAGESGCPECSSQDVSPSRGSGTEGKVVDPAKDEIMPLQPERVDDAQIQTSDKTLDHSIMKGGPPDPVGSSDVSKSVNENLAVKEDSHIYCSEGTAVIGTCGSAAPRQGRHEGQLDVVELNEYTDDAKKMKNSPEKSGVTEISSVSSMLEHTTLSSSADATNVLESAIEPDLKRDMDAKDEDPCPKVSPFADVRTVVSERESGMDDSGSPMVLKAKDQFNTEFLRDFSGSEDRSGESENPKTLFRRIEGFGVAEEQGSDEVEDNSGNDSDFLNPAVDAKDRDAINKRSDIELDPLELARQVAIEVEREVVDCREPSCSSSERISGGGIRQPDSPDSTNVKQSQPIEGPPKEVPAGPNLSAETLPMSEEPFINAETLGAERENRKRRDMESSQVAEAAQESEANTDKGACGFDLNQEVCSEDMDRPLNPISTPISVVSASRAAAATGLPVAPLQFEGTLGWKGSAATSAFRPASPRRIPEGDKSLSSLGSHNSSKQRQDFLDIDLNVAEVGEDKILDLIPVKQIPISSGLPSGESSVEASPRRSERLQLDLNRVSDGDAPSDWRREGWLFQNRNGLHSPSPSSSSSSMQPTLRNIDLNDQPSLFNDSSDHLYLGKLSQNLYASGGLKPDDSVISIMGARVEVKRKDFVPQTLPMLNGRISEPPVEVNLGRTGSVLGMGIGSALPYADSPGYGYNGLTSGPSMPFSSAMYGPVGPIPYMVDSRGAPVVPQILGSTSALPPPFSQPRLIMSMTGAPSGSNGAGPLRHDFDLNSGSMIEGGNRELGGLRQFFNPGQGRSLDEHLRSNSQPSSSSGVGGRRKEPDSGWEPYPLNFKHHQPPWK